MVKVKGKNNAYEKIYFAKSSSVVFKIMTSLENECECKEFAMAWDDCCAYMAEKIIMNFFWLILYNFITEFVILKNIQICKIYRPTFSCFSKFVVNIESSEL